MTHNARYLREKKPLEITRKESSRSKRRTLDYLIQWIRRNWLYPQKLKSKDNFTPKLRNLRLILNHQLTVRTVKTLIRTKMSGRQQLINKAKLFNNFKSWSKNKTSWRRNSKLKIPFWSCHKKPFHLTLSSLAMQIRMRCYNNNLMMLKNSNTLKIKWQLLKVIIRNS